MTDYTPTTEEVRKQYVFSASVIDGTSFVDPTQGEAEFDRWLSGVKAQVWEEGYAHGNADAFTEARLDRDNPYLQEKGSGNSSSQPTAETSNLLNKQDD